MKYMTFNRACSYTCLANLLEEFNIDISDREIIKQAGMPYCFRSYQEQFFAGAMLQGKKWFDLFLNKVGFEYQEEIISRDKLINFLDSLAINVMLGLKVGNSKHACIYKGKVDNKFRFFNPRHIEASEPDYYYYAPEEVIDLVDEDVNIGWIVKLNNGALTDSDIHYQSSKDFIIYSKTLLFFLSKLPEKQELLAEKERLFAPLLLDILAMMEIINNTELYSILKKLQSQYLAVLKVVVEIDIELFKECLSKLEKTIYN